MDVETYIYRGCSTKVWHKNGNSCYWHREDGPAEIRQNSIEIWWYYDKKYNYPKEMPLNLFLAYVKWELKKLNGN